MMTITPPKRPDDYADRGLDCEFAIEPVFQAMAHAAEEAGWSEDEVAAAFLALSAAHIKGIMADRKTFADMQDALKAR